MAEDGVDNSGGELVLRKPGLDLAQAVFLLQHKCAGNGKALAGAARLPEVEVAAEDEAALLARLMKAIEEDSEWQEREGRRGSFSLFLSLLCNLRNVLSVMRSVALWLT